MLRIRIKPPCFGGFTYNECFQAYVLVSLEARSRSEVELVVLVSSSKSFKFQMTVWMWGIQNHIWNKYYDVGSCSTTIFTQQFLCTVYFECFWVTSCSIGFEPWRKRQNLTGYLLDKGCQCSRNDKNSIIRNIKPDLTPSVELPIRIGHHYNIGIWFSIVTSMARPGLVKQSLILWTRQKLSTVARLTFWIATEKNMKKQNH